MEQITLERPHNGLAVVVNNTQAAGANAFITANTIECSLTEIKKEHIIPVFLKDNEPLISHADFIDIAGEVVSTVFHREIILKPSIRVSHKIMGRVPEAKYKPAKELFEWEKTIYFERMAFVIEIPFISEEIDGSRLSLAIGGVKAYNLDNLNSRKGTDEHFKIFIGFQNKVCTNLCISSDGLKLDLKVKSPEQLVAAIHSLIQNYRQEFQFNNLKDLSGYSLTEQQFAILMGRCRMYQHLPLRLRKDIQPLLFNDTQLGALCRDYYKDDSFSRSEDGCINLWRLYNLFTGINKTSYIDTFLERGNNAFDLANGLKSCLQSGGNWYLS